MTCMTRKTRDTSYRVQIYLFRYPLSGDNQFSNRLITFQVCLDLIVTVIFSLFIQLSLYDRPFASLWLSPSIWWLQFCFSKYSHFLLSVSPLFSHSAFWCYVILIAIKITIAVCLYVTSTHRSVNPAISCSAFIRNICNGSKHCIETVGLFVCLLVFVSFLNLNRQLLCIAYTIFVFQYRDPSHFILQRRGNSGKIFFYSATPDCLLGMEAASETELTTRLIKLCN